MYNYKETICNQQYEYNNIINLINTVNLIKIKKNEKSGRFNRVHNVFQSDVKNQIVIQYTKYKYNYQIYMQKYQLKGKQYNWQTQRAFLLQKIQLYQITISQMKQRQQKIRRINQTLMNSLSSTQTGSNGIHQVLQQQSAQIARLHEKLQKKRQVNRMHVYPANIQYNENLDIKVLTQQNRQLKKRLQQGNIQRQQNLRYLKSVQQKELRKSHEIQESRFQSKTKTNKKRNQIGMNSSFNYFDQNKIQDIRQSNNFNKDNRMQKKSSVCIKYKTCKTQKDEKMSQKKQSATTINMNGYINFIKQNSESINSQLLKLKSNNIFWYS